MTENCAENKIRLVSAMRGELPAADAAELKKHLAECADCKREYDELRALDAMLSSVPAAELRSDAKDRLKARISRRRIIIYRYAAAAAIAAAVIVACVLFLMPQNTPKNQPVAETPKTVENKAVANNPIIPVKNVPEIPAPVPEEPKKAVVEVAPVRNEIPKTPEKSVEPTAPAPKDDTAAAENSGAPENTAKNPEIAPVPTPEAPVKTPETPKPEEAVVSKPSEGVENNSQLTELPKEDETEFEPLALSTTALEGAVYIPENPAKNRRNSKTGPRFHSARPFPHAYRARRECRANWTCSLR